MEAETVNSLKSEAQKLAALDKFLVKHNSVSGSDRPSNVNRRTQFTLGTDKLNLSTEASNNYKKHETSPETIHRSNNKETKKKERK